MEWGENFEAPISLGHGGSTGILPETIESAPSRRFSMCGIFRGDQARSLESALG